MNTISEKRHDEYCCIAAVVKDKLFFSPQAMARISADHVCLDKQRQSLLLCTMYIMSESHSFVFAALIQQVMCCSSTSILYITKKKKKDTMFLGWILYNMLHDTILQHSIEVSRSFNSRLQKNFTVTFLRLLHSYILKNAVSSLRIAQQSKRPWISSL